jgi:hypothetical protein
MNKVQTDSTYFKEKVFLRINSLPKKKEIFVLDCFSGDGLIWDEVKKNTNIKINILRIDLKKKSKGLYLIGDNKKFLSEIDLKKFDIIDLDAYGSPFKQLEIIFKRKYKGIVHCTFIQSIYGNLNKSLLIKIGYTEKMIQKIPAIFNKNGFEKMCQYLYVQGVKKITLFQNKRKNYFYFSIK